MPVILGIIVFLADQITKWQIGENMHLGQTIPVIKNAIHITYVLNPGAAFGIMENQRFVFIGVAVVLIIGTIFFYKRLLQESRILQYGAMMLLGGAAGNLFDRIQTGLVVDFIDLRIWPVFNIADIAICLGAGFVIFDICFRRENHETDI